jgi:SAM-dependent methyltransferase
MVESHVATRLSCPRCYDALSVRSNAAQCGLCGVVATIAGDVVSFEASVTEAYFDERVEELNTTTTANWSFSYAQQVSILSPYLDRARTVIDIGCGSRLPYLPRPDTFVIGVDLSVDALRSNRRLDLRVHGSAARLPVRSASIDLVVCFYSLHHMIGATVPETRGNVIECLRECARVLAPGGTLFIVENNPRGLFREAQRWGWAAAKIVLRRHLDMFFWSQRELDRLLVTATGRRATEVVTFDTHPLTVISPLFAVPQLKVFRFMHPLNCSVSIWNNEAGAAEAKL